MLISPILYYVLMTVSFAVVFIVLLYFISRQISSSAKVGRYMGLLVLALMIPACIVYMMEKYYTSYVYTIREVDSTYEVSTEIIVGEVAYQEENIKGILQGKKEGCIIINHTNDDFKIDQLSYGFSSSLLYIEKDIRGYGVHQAYVRKLDLFPDETPPATLSSNKRGTIYHHLRRAYRPSSTPAPPDTLENYLYIH